MTRWLGAFLLTQLVEVPLYRRPLGPRTLAAFGASAITHPVVWFVIPRAWDLAYLWAIARWPALVVRSPTARYVLMVLAAEAFAVAVEAAYLRALGVRRALAWSLLANAASVAVGLTVRAAFGWP